MHIKKTLLGAGALAVLMPGVAMAQEAGVDDTAFIFNTLSFLMHGFLVMFMAAGFCMLEAGSVRSKNATAIVVKNMALYSLAGLMFYLVGYNLMYDGVDGGYFGSFSTWFHGGNEATAEMLETGYAPASDWFFQMVFVATAASIVSGTVAERVRLWPFLAFVAVLTGFIYPITGAWEWGAGWLDAEWGFSDFAGSTLVHSVGGWAALAGALILGARKGRFNADGSVNALPGSSMPLVALGTFILWLGWFGFNGGSQLALGSANDAISIANIYVNTNIAAAAGLLGAMVISSLVYGKVDGYAALNGALGGLVSITAEPLMPSMLQAIAIGAIGGALVVVFSNSVMLKLKIDDVVGAIPVHLVCGIWGTLVVPLSNSDATFVGQLVGVVAIGAFAFATSAIVWFVLKKFCHARATEEQEELGLDVSELGNRAYPEFV